MHCWLQVVFAGSPSAADGGLSKVAHSAGMSVNMDVLLLAPLMLLRAAKSGCMDSIICGMSYWLQLMRVFTVVVAGWPNNALSFRMNVQPPAPAVVVLLLTLGQHGWEDCSQ